MDVSLASEHSPFSRWKSILSRELIISLYVSAMIDLKEIMAADLICSELVRKSSLVRQGGY